MEYFGNQFFVFHKLFIRGSVGIHWVKISFPGYPRKMKNGIIITIYTI